jgi:hypothetical protein
MRLRLLATAVATSLLTAASAHAADPIPGATYTGTTDTGSAFQFTVAPDGATIIDLLSSATLTCVGSQGGIEVAALATKTPIPVAGGTISGNEDTTVPRLEISGTFTSVNEAAGTVIARMAKFDYSGGGLTTCMRELRWTARTSASGGSPSAPSGPTGGDDAAGTAAGASPVATVSFPKGVKLRPSLGNGWIVGGTVAGPTTLTGTVTLAAKDAKRYGLGRRAKVIARATETLDAAGEFGLEFKPGTRVARKHKRARKLTFALHIVSRVAGAGPSTTDQKITLGP